MHSPAFKPAVALIIACLIALAGLAQQVTLSVKNVPLTKVFPEIEKQTGFTFYYQFGLLDSTLPVTLDLKNAPLQQVLDQCFLNQPVIYEIVRKTIVVKPRPAVPKEPAVALIRGLVTDSAGNPLAGATVMVKGRGQGIQTGAHGDFQWNIDKEADLLISFTGYTTQEWYLKGETFITVKLQLAPVKLNDVIVVNTGYQSLPKERSAGSFATADMNTVANRSYSMNVLQRLDGLIPGLTINNAPGAAQNPYLIRGLTTIGIKANNGYDSYGGVNRNPLVVIDGIPTEDLTFLNPQDVKDITVLKDATAASIWGARASNGVIVIATKKGEKNQKLKIVYDGFLTVQSKPDLNYFPVLDSRQYIQAAREVFDPVLYPWSLVSANDPAFPAVPPHEKILYNQYRGLISAQQAGQQLDSLASINNKAQIGDLWYRSGALTNHTLSVSGGGKSYSFYGSLAYTGTQTHVPGEKNDLFKVNLRQDLQFNDHISLYLITDVTNLSASAARPIQIDARFYPYQLFRGTDGKNISIPYVQGIGDSARSVYESRSRISLDYNPLDEFNRGHTSDESVNTRVIAGTTIRLIKGLRFEGLYGLSKNDARTTSFDNGQSYGVRRELVSFTVAPDPSIPPVYYLPSNGGKYSVSNSTLRTWSVRNQLVYDHSSAESMHQITLLAGQEVQEKNNQLHTTRLRGYNEELQTNAPIDYATLTSNGVFGAVLPNTYFRSVLADDLYSAGETTLRFTSYYGNAAYTYASRYTVNASWRQDQSNLFGKDRSAQNKPVWSVGGKWDLGKEPFLKSVAWLDQLAIRATYGITGNSPNPGTSSSYDILRPEKGDFFVGGLGLSLLTAANKKLSWEQTSTWNSGIDFSLRNGRLKGSVDAYIKHTDNLIGDSRVNSFTGFSSVIGNFGTLENKGIEVQLNSLNIGKRDFSWNTIWTVAYNKNKITQLNSLVPVVNGDDVVARSYLGGYPSFSLFAYRYAGLDRTGDPQIRLSDKSVTKTPHVSTPADIRYMGTYQPAWSGGLSNIFHYRMFTLNINIIYNLGYSMRRDANSFYSGRLIKNLSAELFTGNVHGEFANRWRQPGDESRTNIPGYIGSSALSDGRRETDYYTLGDLNVVSASYAKIRDMGLSYNLPHGFTERLKMNELTFRLQVSNIMIWKANKYGIDPEFQDAFAGQRTLPVNQHAFTVGLHASF